MEPLLADTDRGDNRFFLLLLIDLGFLLVVQIWTLRSSSSIYYPGTYIFSFLLIVDLYVKYENNYPIIH